MENTFYIETTIENMFDIAMALRDAGLVDDRRGIVSGMRGAVAWVAIREDDYPAAIDIATTFDRSAAVAWSPDYVGDAVAAIAAADHYPVDRI